MKTKNHTKIRAHDAIVGVLYLASALLAYFVDVKWIFVAVAVAGLQIISPLTKFCPVYFVLNKLMPESDPIQGGG
jgi:hypothetical protein